MSDDRFVMELRVELRGSAPLIWRRFEVFADITLPRLHRALQIVMGWENRHLHAFRIGGNLYGPPDPEDGHLGMPILDERRVPLHRIIPPIGAVFAYTYDFGDDWVHDIFLESFAAAHARKRYPVCTAGERSAPPEDVGGIPGYAHYLEALRDIRHKEHQAMLNWRGRFDPEYFSVPAVNRALHAQFPVRPPSRTKRAAARPATTEEEFDQIVRSVVRNRRLPRLKGNDKPTIQ